MQIISDLEYKTDVCNLHANSEPPHIEILNTTNMAMTLTTPLHFQSILLNSDTDLSLTSVQLLCKHTYLDLFSGSIIRYSIKL